MYLKKYINIIIILIVVVACKTTSKLSDNTVKTYQNVNIKPRNFGIGRLIDSVTSKYLFYDIVSVKFKAHVKLVDQSHSFDGVFRIKKDSLIWVSLNVPLGIEIARFILTKDSIYFMNKLKKEYFVSNYSFFDYNYHIELKFDDIQSVLTNQIFLFSETDEESNLMMNKNSNEKEYIRKTFFRDKDSIYYILKTHRKHKIKRYLKKRPNQQFIVENIKIITSTFKIQVIEILDYIEGRNLKIQYDQFENINNELFPMSLNFYYSDSVKNYQLQLNYSKVTIGEDVSFSFKIPKSYKRIQ